MKEPTMDEMFRLVDFDRNQEGILRIRKVCANVWGDVQGSVWGSVWGAVEGKISGREWQFVETPKERAIRLIREGKGEEAIKVLEEQQ